MRKALRKGFTLIELMVVIGIILLLVSITVFGLRHVNAMAARKETIAEMNICQGMLKEYESVNGTINIEGACISDATGNPIKIPYPDPTQPMTNTLSFVGPVYAYSISSGVPATGTSPSYISINDLTGSPTGDMSDRGGFQDARYYAPAVHRTQSVMYVLLKDSKNRAALAAVSPKRILEGPPSQTVAPTYPADYSVVLDGWANPIIYVPKGGMLVWMNTSGTASNASNYIVRSSGTYLAKPDGTFSFTAPNNSNDAPFWASAGQDQIFTDPQSKTDNAVDNIYSFQQQ